ncbi:MAG: 2-amino-4-hydroxy-6-hydroxymethyldihydropteridine diphosphokinase [Planctomycetales bacterium]
MNRCWIALGGNQGDVSATFQAALRDLEHTSQVQVRAVSSEFRTVPVGRNAGSPYLNAAAELTTILEPLPLLDLLQSVENRHGRIREKHWGPRTLDLDLLLIDDRTVHEPRLTVPHPYLWFRRFVLDPLAEIAPDAWHPDKECTIGELRSQLLPRPLKCQLFGSDQQCLSEVRSNIVKDFPEVQFSFENPALNIWLPGDGENASARQVWEQLPLRSRLDLSQYAPPAQAESTLRDILHAALGR